jgi:hypothetical protein
LKVKLRKKAEPEAPRSAAPVQAAPEKPYVFVNEDGTPKDGRVRLRHITTDAPEAKAKTKLDPIEPGPVKRGPAIGRQLSDADFIAVNGTEEEKQMFRAAVQARMAKTGEVWRQCDKCNFVWDGPSRQPEGSPCPKCNYRGLENGGHMRTMSAELVRQYKAWKAAEDKRIEANLFQAALNERNAERGRAGLPAFTPERFREERNEEYRRMVERQRMIPPYQNPALEK